MSASVILTRPELEALLIRMDKENAGQNIRMESKTVGRATKNSRTTGESFESVFQCAKVWKIASQTFQVGCDYEKVVNAHRAKEGLEKDFKSEGTYGEMETRTLLRKDDGSFQMRVFSNGVDASKNRWVRDDGTELTPDLVARLRAEFLPIRKEEAPKQGVEKTVQPRNFAPDSIIGFRVAGMEYVMARI